MSKSSTAEAKLDAIMEICALTIERSLSQRQLPLRARRAFDDIFADVSGELIRKYKEKSDPRNVVVIAEKHGAYLKHILDEDGNPILA